MVLLEYINSINKNESPWIIFTISMDFLILNIMRVIFKEKIISYWGIDNAK